VKTLVTGGRGFIGGALVERLRGLGHEVGVFDKVDGQDILDPAAVDRAVEGMDAVFHIAAAADLNWARDHPRESMALNVEGTTNIVDACAPRGVRLLYASTCCVYGNQEHHPEDESTLPNPSEIYACSKLAGEYVVLGYHRMFGMPFTILRFATIYGPGMRDALAVHVFLDQALRGQPFTVHGDGTQTRTLTYIDDLIDGCVAALDKGHNETLNLSTEEEITVRDMIDRIKTLTGSKSDIRFIAQRPGQVLREAIDASRARRVLGWVARTSFQEGLERTYDWMLSKYATNEKQETLRVSAR
jgi:UDP-glucose 4-epimerase